jgi:hypothetical protein
LKVCECSEFFRYACTYCFYRQSFIQTFCTLLQTSANVSGS